MLFSWIYFMIIFSCSVQCWYSSFFTNSSLTGYLHRVIRQTKSCRSFERQCNSGDCVSNRVFCDGTVDCADGSDETLSACAYIPCPNFSFQCAYGACVSGDAKCDNIKNCADNSDETLPECKNIKKNAETSLCEKGEILCNDRTCINKYLVCDGTLDCPDGSDETFVRCKHFPCDKPYFQCRYGACVNGEAPCNGIEECADASDELPSLCTVNINLGDDVQSTCVLPPVPVNGYYTVNERLNFEPGNSVTGIVRLDFFCQNGYQLDGIADVSCGQNNRWNRPFPTCLRTCSPRISSTLDIKCTRNGYAVDCTKPVLHGTQALVKCKQFYHFPPYNSVPFPYDQLVCEDGSWDYNLAQCIPVCGRKNAKGIPNIVGGDKAKIGEYPWHVGIYIKTKVFKDITYTQICGGSIINPKVIISAAHCFENNRDFKQYGVAAGKYYRSWDELRDKYAQLRNVEKLYIPEIYKGIQHNYLNDIAIVVVDKLFEFHNIVNPICIDWTGNIDRQLLVSGSIGYAAGWGLEQGGGSNMRTPSIELKHLELPFVAYDICYKNSPKDFQAIIGLPDKICAGRTDGQSVCEGDSGGGLTFQFGDLFYLMGIVSIGPDKLGGCDPSKYTTFTKISYHALWLNNITRFNTPAR